MKTLLCVALGLIVTLWGGTYSAFAAPIGMPDGSKVWMKWEASVCPDADGDDCLGSNRSGPNPPFGIPWTTLGSGSNTATGYAEIMPGRIRSYTRGVTSGFIHSSFEDTYTVLGTASGPFEIPVAFRATGEATSVGAGCPSSICNQLVGANGEVKIGTFNVLPSGQYSEGLRVSEFSAASRTNFSFPTEASGNPFTRPIDVTATHTVQSVNVGDSFTLAFGMNARFSRGEIDLLASGGGVISFALPPGVMLSSARAHSLLPDFFYLVGNVGVTDLTGVSVVTGDVVIEDNSNLTTINAADLVSVTGSIDISDNSNAGSLDLGSMQSVGGAINVAENASMGSVDLGSLETSGGAINVAENASTGSIDLGSLETSGGSINVAGNTSTGSIDLGSLQSVTGSITVTDNGSATVNMAAGVDVTGSLTLESTGTGNLDLGDATVGGDSNVTAEGYTTVEATTAAGATAVTMINDAATMEVALPNGAFTSATPVAFSVTNLPGGEETVDGQTITHLSRYAFDFAIPTLNSQAELNFQIDLAAMDEPDRVALLDLLHDDAVLTIGVLGDAPDAELQLFDVCAPQNDPVVDGCAVVLWFDVNGNPLDPMGGVDPTVLRFEALVGHFSTYSVIAVSSSRTPGDIDEDGDVDRNDAALFAQSFGLESGSVWGTGDFDGDFATSLADLALLQANLGQGSRSPATAAVPEPCSLMMLASALSATLTIWVNRTSVRTRRAMVRGTTSR